MTSWPIKKLGEVIQLQYGKGIASSDRKEDGEYPIYGANGILGKTDRALTSGEAIIVGRKGSAGELIRVSGKFWPSDVTYYVFGNDRVHIDYLFHFLKSINLPSLAVGVKPGINRNRVYEIEIPLPPIAEQRKIVARIEKQSSKLDEIMRLCEESTASTAQLVSAALNESFFEVGSKGWKFVELGKITKFIDYRGKTPAKVSSGLRLITAKNVKLGYLSRMPEEFVEPSIYNSWMTRGFPKRGDVLFTTEAPLGNVAQLDTDERVVFAQRVIILQPQKELLPPFLKYLLMGGDVRDNILSQATGVTAQGIKAAKLKLVKIPLPSLVAQKAIIKKLNVLSEKVLGLQRLQAQQAADLKALKRSILHEAFADGIA